MSSSLFRDEQDWCVIVKYTEEPFLQVVRVAFFWFKDQVITDSTNGERIK